MLINLTRNEIAAINSTALALKGMGTGDAEIFGIEIKLDSDGSVRVSCTDRYSAVRMTFARPTHKNIEGSILITRKFAKAIASLRIGGDLSEVNGVARFRATDGTIIKGESGEIGWSHYGELFDRDPVQRGENDPTLEVPLDRLAALMRVHVPSEARTSAARRNQKYEVTERGKKLLQMFRESSAAGESITVISQLAR